MHIAPMLGEVQSCMATRIRRGRSPTQDCSRGPRRNRVTSIKRLLACVLLVIATSPALACQFDVDCFPGSKCIKNGTSLYGACVGGINPGNANDKKPIYNPMDLNRGSGNTSTGDARSGGLDADGTYGDTCSFDVNCGPGRKCVKGSGIYGTCM